MKKPLLLLSFFSLLSFTPSSAQISQGGEPFQWVLKSATTLNPLVLKSLDSQRIQSVLDMPAVRGESFKWGIPRAINKNLLTAGQAQSLSGGQLVRMSIKSPGARMLSVYFSQFDLVEGATLFLYDKEKTQFLGGFTKESELPSGEFATAVLPSDEIVIEYFQPWQAKGKSRIEIGNIVHGVRDLFSTQFKKPSTKDYNPGFGAQGCHNNVTCPIATGWEQQIRSVAMFLNTQGWGCNGVLVNNTLQNGRPLFHIANHCYIPDVATWVFYWNYESPTCVGDTGQTVQTQTGASLLSALYEDDFALLELFQTPPAAYNVYYAGWDATGNQPTSQTVIHHPLYDVKKIAFDYDPASSYTDAIGINMWGCTWESGIVEFVSSGAPLFDQNKRMIGHMTEGNNQCTTVSSEVTGCAKLSESWNGTQASTRLVDHLDPSNTGLLVLDGLEPFSLVASVQLPIKLFMAGPYDAGVGTMRDELRSNGLLPLQEPYSGLSYAFVDGGGEETNTTILNNSGINAVVDWIVVELRDANDNQVIVSSKAALLRKDGSSTNADGTPLSFNVPPGNYFVAVRHRNHLGIITSSALYLSSNTALIDFSNGAVQVLDGQNNAMAQNNGVYMLWSGDVNFDGSIKYTGSNNDRDALLISLGGSSPTAVLNGYSNADINMDGSAKYTGSLNDRDPILLNIGGNAPTNVKNASLP